jgi:hypothetical protein
VPSRVTWTLPLPHDGVLRASARSTATARVRFRIGISDNRTYEALAEATPSPGTAAPIEIDLGAYAGRKWSIFYRPDQIQWRLSFSADAIEGAAEGLWIAPQILTTRDGATEYRQRRWGNARAR